MTDISTWTGVSTTWPTFTPSAWSAEGVAESVVAYVTGAAVPGLRAIYTAMPVDWDKPENFYGSGIPWGVGAFLDVGAEKQTETYAGTGKPERKIVHTVSIICLFKSTLNDTSAVKTLALRIEDGIKDALRADPTLGARVYEAGVGKLDVKRDGVFRDQNNAHCTAFQIDFDVTVFAPPGA